MLAEIKVPGPSKNQVSILDIYLVQFLTAGMINEEPTNPATDCIKHKDTS
jgi:hypothetical protein